jgi:hypothetical protein
MILYLQISLTPFPVRFKIGITRRSWKGRSRNIAKTTRGKQFALPIIALTPFPETIERALHVHFSYCHHPMAEGSGKTEWFRVGVGGLNLFEAICFYLALMEVQIGAVILIVKHFLK